jgi:ATP-binding protein involved in chromosome partitioning
MDEGAVRAAIASAVSASGEPLLAAEDVGRIVIDGAWLVVLLTSDRLAREGLARLHEHLRASFPQAAVELRRADTVYRGGAGFGEGNHVLAVFGGKGGVGKSTIAVNLALTLHAMGLAVGLLDADLNAPDIPHMLGLHPKKPPRGFGMKLSGSKVTAPSERMRPHERLGVELMSVGFAVPEGYAPMMTSRALVSMLLRHLLFDVGWSARIIVIDAPPGTGEELQVLAGELPLSGAIFVTTPQDLAQMDAERTLAFLSQHDVPVIGLVQNMAFMTCPHCDQEIDLYAQSRRLQDAGLRVLGRIPFDVELSKAADGGRPLVLGDPRGPIAYEFARIGAQVRGWLEARGDVA